jgi:glycosyltransferase involved in cell wall biosynthesis
VELPFIKDIKMKKKLLIFHPALAPYRVDQFNSLSRIYDLEVVFLFENLLDHKFDQDKLRSQLVFKYSYLLSGPILKGRVFRYGMLKVIRNVKPDIILGYEYSPTTQYLLLLKTLGIIRQKIGSTIDDSLAICKQIQSKSRLLARKYSINKLDYLILLSKEVSEFYQSHLGIEESKIIVSPILQDPAKLRTKSLEPIALEYAKRYGLFGKKILLFVGRFVPEKALPNFISTIAPILKSQEDLYFVLIGDGDERKQIEKILHEHQITEKILAPGRFEGLELNAWYLCASGFVLPSVSETFGAVVNESLIFGVPVLCSVYAGASSLINPENGSIFDPLSITETIDKTEEFLRNIPIMDKIDLEYRASYMEDQDKNFTTQWGKMNAN